MFYFSLCLLALFLTAILHLGLRNCFVYASFTFSNFSLDFYFPFSIWTFISPFFLYFYFPFLFGLLSPFYIWTFISFFFLDFYFPFIFGLLFNSSFNSCFNFFHTNCGHILDFFQNF